MPNRTLSGATRRFLRRYLQETMLRTPETPACRLAAERTGGRPALVGFAIAGLLSVEEQWEDMRAEPLEPPESALWTDEMTAAVAEAEAREHAEATA